MVPQWEAVERDRHQVDEELPTMSTRSGRYRRPRQNLRVRLTDGPSIVMDGAHVWSTDAKKGSLLVFDRKGHMCARFAKGTWQSAVAVECVARHE